jgi:transposase
MSVVQDDHFCLGREARVKPERYGQSKPTNMRYRWWCKSGVFARIFETLAADANNEFMMIDATIVRAHQHSAGAQKRAGETQAIGRSRGGLKTKIHAVVDALGNPVALSPPSGQVADITQAAGPPKT